MVDSPVGVKLRSSGERLDTTARLALWSVSFLMSTGFAAALSATAPRAEPFFHDFKSFQVSDFCSYVLTHFCLSQMPGLLLLGFTVGSSRLAF